MASDGFFFDVEKWFGSISAQRMSFAEKGVYLTMLFQQWRDKSKSLPDDPSAVADLIAVTPAQSAEVEAAWAVVRTKFQAVERAAGRIQNVTIEETRRQQARNFRKRQEAGRVAGKASASKRHVNKQLPVNDSLTVVERSSTDKRREEESREEKKGLEEKRDEVQEFVALWNARTKPPIPRCEALSDDRRKHIRARLKKRPLAEWGPIFDRVASSPFCLGQVGKDWVATIDWLIRSDNQAIRVLEGTYDERRTVTRTTSGASDRIQHNAAVVDEFERLMFEREDAREH